MPIRAIRNAVTINAAAAVLPPIKKKLHATVAFVARSLAASRQTHTQDVHSTAIATNGADGDDADADDDDDCAGAHTRACIIVN